DVKQTAFERREHVGGHQKAHDPATESDNPRAATADFANVADARMFQLLAFEFVDHDAIRQTNCLRIAVPRTPRVAHQRGGIATDHDDLFESAAGERHSAMTDDVAFG